MSKFIDKLTRLSKGEAQGIGFTARQSASSRPRMQIVARLAVENVDTLAGRVEGADFGIIDVSDAVAGVSAMEKLLKSWPETVWGTRVESLSRDDIKKLIAAGCDFVIFPSGAPVTIMRDEKETGKILELESSITERLVRTAGGLPVDGVLLDGGLGENEAITWQHMMVVTGFAGFLSKPLIVPVPSKVSVGELESLWEAGINAVVIKIDAQQPQDRLKILRQEVEKTNFISRRSGKADAMISRPGQSSGARQGGEDG